MSLKDRMMPFGKHRGVKYLDIPKDYFRWALNNLDTSNRELPHIREYLGYAPADGYISKVYDKAVFPRTLEVLSLVRATINEGWRLSNTKAILADAIEEAGFTEPDSIYSILNAMRDPEKAVPIRPFFDLLCLPVLSGDKGASMFYHAGEPHPHDMSDTNGDPWQPPRSTLSYLGGQVNYGPVKPFTRADVVDVVFDRGGSTNRACVRLSDGRTACINTCDQIWCKGCGKAWVVRDISKGFTALAMREIGRSACSDLLEWASADPKVADMLRGVLS